MGVSQKPTDWRNAKFLRGVRNLQQAADQLKNDLQDRTDQFAKTPQFVVGGRAYIMVSGKPLALAQRCTWRTSVSADEIRTVDTHMSWDIAVGQTSIQVSLSELVDPNSPAETEGTWATMASLIHQPAIELEIFDKMGERIFFARGMFTSMSCGIGNGSLAERSLEFLGIAYAHNVDQSFKPYDPKNEIASAFKEASKKLRTITGGMF